MIDYEFLKELRGKDDMHMVVPEPEKIQRVKERINIVNEEFLRNRPRVKSMKMSAVMNLNELFLKENPIKKQEQKSKKIKSLPSVKRSEPCPEGYIRSVRSGKCIKDKKYKMLKAKKVNVDNSILKILKEIKG